MSLVKMEYKYILIPANEACIFLQNHKTSMRKKEYIIPTHNNQMFSYVWYSFILPQFFNFINYYLKKQQLAQKYKHRCVI